ncbi:MAG: diguanylate cyclase [Actinobacteria bacterium]|nr:MAG: diguanylate cyclase [Actinomycetota bacterium]
MRAACARGESTLSDTRRHSGGMPPANPLPSDVPSGQLGDALFRQLVEHASDIVVVTEAEPLDEPGPRIVYVNQAFTELTGYAAHEVLGRNPRFLQRRNETDSDTLHQMRSTLDRRADYHGAVLNFGKDGTPYWLDIRIFPLLDSTGTVTHFAAVERDITARTLAELDLRQAALHDPLTGLLNRRGFHQIVVRSWDPTAGGAVLSIDVDRFKGINDSLGHAAGDRVLTDLADAVASATGDAGFAARTGGDEFVVALPGADLATATAVAERVRRNLDGATPPESANGAAALSGVSATISIGLAADDAYCELASLLAASDEALYRAKEAGGDATAQREGAGIRQQPVAPRPPGA